MPYRPWPAFGMVDGPMPTPSWVPCGNDRFWGWVGYGGMLLGVGGEGGVVGVLLAVGTALVLCGVAVWVVGWSRASGSSV
jgi:hypothetical protein